MKLAPCPLLSPKESSGPRSPGSGSGSGWRACSLGCLLPPTPAAAPADRLAVGINSSTFTLRSLEVNSFPAKAGKAGGAGSGCREPREGGGVHPHLSLPSSAGP